MLGRDVGPVVGFELCGWDLSEFAVKASVVEPVDVFSDGELDVDDRLPPTLGPHHRVADALSLEERVEGLGHRVVVGVASASDGGDGLGLGQSLGAVSAELRRLAGCGSSPPAGCDLIAQRQEDRAPPEMG